MKHKTEMALSGAKRPHKHYFEEHIFFTADLAINYLPTNVNNRLVNLHIEMYLSLLYVKLFLAKYKIDYLILRK